MASNRGTTLGGAILAGIAITAIFLLAKSPDNQVVDPKESPLVTTTSTEISVEKTSTTLCIEHDNVDDWPIQESMTSWNTNGKNVLSFASLGCDAKIIIQRAIIDDKAWAATTFFDNGVISIMLSPDVPPEHRQHVVCHEFAHVFGLPHTQAQSCSNINLTVPTPSADEIQWVGSGLWKWQVARVSALHGER